MRAAIVAIACAACGSSSPQAPVGPSASLEALGAEYRRLRAIPGHFGGGAWNDAVDRFGGRKHVLMEELGRELADASRAEIIAVMGAPDAIATPGHALWHVAPAGAAEVLVYFWRGAHDVLYFSMRGDDVIASGWWMAGE